MPERGDHPGPTDEAGLRAEIAILTETVERLAVELAGLRRAMSTRADIEQAKGALRVVSGVSSDEAFAVLAERSQHSNRRLIDVARDVLAQVKGPAPRTALLELVNAQQTNEARGDAPPFHSRLRWSESLRAVAEPDQLRALSALGGRLAAARDRADVVDVLVGAGADALGAFAAAVATSAGPGRLAITYVGRDPEHSPGPDMSLGAPTPIADTMRTGEPILLPTRAELSLRFPAETHPQRVQALAVLPLNVDGRRLGAWELVFDRPLRADRGTRSLLQSAAEVAATALDRAR